MNYILIGLLISGIIAVAGTNGYFCRTRLEYDRKRGKFFLWHKGKIAEVYYDYKSAEDNCKRDLIAFKNKLSEEKLRKPKDFKEETKKLTKELRKL